ncbi:MAG: transposase family protein [Sphingomicrobium sp.]
MAHYNLDKSTVLMIEGVPHKSIGETTPGTMHIINGITGATYIHEYPDGTRGLPTYEAFDELLLDGRLEIIRHRGGGAIAISDMDAQDCSEIDPKSAKILAQCQVLDEHGVKNGIKGVIDGLAKYWTGSLVERFGECDNPHSVKRWRLTRGKPGQRTQREMVRMWGRGPGAPFFDNDVNDCIQRGALAYYVVKTTFKAVESEVCGWLLDINAGLNPDYPKPDKPYPIPCYATIRRACIALENSITLAARDGEQIIDAEWRGAGKRLTAGRALELGIVDHSPLPQWCVIDPEREIVLGMPWLSPLLDVHSRVVLGHVLTFRDPSFWTVAECIRRANLPKRPPPAMLAMYPGLQRICGGNHEIIVDNGTEFRGHGLEDLAKSAGFGIRFCPLGKPRYKGIVERFFGTVFSKIQESLPGSSRTIAWSRKSGYDASKAAVVTLDCLEALLNQIIAEYHTETHDGLACRQPLLVWEKSTAKHGIDLHHDVKGFMNELMDVRLGVQLSGHGIRMFGLRYHNVKAVPTLLDDLAPLEPRRQRRDDATVTVKVKYSPENIYEIHVWNRRTMKYVPLQCDDETYSDGMPLAFHEDIQAAAKAEGAAFNTREARLEARSWRIEAVRNITADAKKHEKETLAKLLEIPRIRQITGNIVHLHTVKPHPVTIESFVAHDLASMTALDNEILAPREPIGSNTRKKNTKRDSRDAGTPVRKKVTERPVRRSSRRISGNYK